MSSKNFSSINSRRNGAASKFPAPTGVAKNMKPKSKIERGAKMPASPNPVLDLNGQNGGAAMLGSEACFSQMVNAMPLLAWIARPDGHIFWYNQRWYEYLGITPKQMDNSGWEKFHDPVELPKVVARWKASLKTRKTFEMTFPLRGADGIFRQFLTRVIPLKNAAGRVLQWFGTNTDVDELMRVEEALSHSEQLHRVAFDLAPTGIAYSKPDGHLFKVNENMCEITGYSAAELMRMKISDLTHPDDQLREAATLTAFMHGEAPNFEIKERYIRKDGLIRWVSVMARMVPDAAGRPLHTIAAVQDITNRKQAEDKLKISEIRYRRLFETAHDGVLLLDPGTRKIIDANPFMTELLGYPHNELVGKELFQIGLLKDEAASQEMFAKLTKKHEVRYEDLPLKSQTGRLQEVEVVANLYQEAGHSVIQCNIRDITERKQAEIHSVRLAAIVESSDDAIIGMDMKGNVTDWNKGAEKIFGYSASEMVGYSITRLIPASRSNEEEKILRKIRSGISVEHFETQRQTKDGRLIDVSVTASPIRQKNGKIAGVSKVARDTTQQRHAEAAQRRIALLAASNAKLENEVNQRRTLEATLKKSEQHQIALLKQSQLMQEQLRRLSREILSAQEEERREISRELHDVIAQTLTGINVRLAALAKEATINTKHLDRDIASTQRLVEKSVDIVHRFARELRPAVLDDLGLIPALHSFVKTFSKRTHIHIHLQAFAGVEELDIVKRTVLFRVAQEALTNVARHAKASRVELNLVKLPDGVVMRIKDNGKSFDVERTLQANAGKRLGLLGMRERVEMVGGTFGVKSVPGEGTTIQVEMPAAKSRGGIADKKIR